MTRSVKLTDYALLLLLATLWGASYSFIKLGVATIPPVTFIAARTLIASALLLVVMRLRGVPLPRDPRIWRFFVVQAVLNSVVPFTLIAWAERSIDAGLATILNSTTPIFTFLLTWAVTRHEAVTARKLFGVVAGMGGICLIIGLESLAQAGSNLVPQLGVVIATISYACAVIFARNFQGHDPMVPAAGSMLCGGLLLVPLSLLIDQPWSLTPSTDSVLALLGLAVFSTALAFTIYFRLIHVLGSVGTAAQAYLRVPVGVAISIVFLGETMRPTAWIGLICVVVGVAAMTLPRRRPSTT
ncbi:DMT family transporter [Roseiterribacter gracilis]|uniref:Membrane protein n=1 Tax=Roseiterribacter gracilis TaxID=2812848 RepID=A0A8S8XFA7_9PROT|nr:membrane protein [Rhodospirillales bacterium TMPK1]